MKIIESSFLFALLAATTSAQCMDSIEQDIDAATKLSFTGFAPAVNR